MIFMNGASWASAGSILATLVSIHLRRKSRQSSMSMIKMENNTAMLLVVAGNLAIQ
jgi:hypothetical protein